MTDYYRVSIFDPNTSIWTLVGPTFANREAAVAHMDGLDLPIKRVVTVNEAQPTPESAAEPNRLVLMAEAGLDADRIAFVRWLVQTGQINDNAPGYEADDGALPEAVTA